MQSAPLPDDLVHTSLLAELLAAFESKISAKISAVTTPPPFPQQVAANGNGVFSYGAAAAASSGGGGSASGVSLSDVNAMVAAAIQAALSAIDHLTANTVTATNATLTNATVTTLHVTGTATLELAALRLVRRHWRLNCPHLRPAAIGPVEWHLRARLHLVPRHPGRYRCMGRHHRHACQSDRSSEHAQCQTVARAVVRDDNLGARRRQQSLLYQRPRRRTLQRNFLDRNAPRGTKPRKRRHYYQRRMECGRHRHSLRRHGSYKCSELRPAAPRPIEWHLRARLYLVTRHLRRRRFLCLFHPALGCQHLLGC